MNDPLLPPPPPNPGASPLRTRKKTRRPGVANSAKILATGLATTATLGLTTGYALASKNNVQPTPQPANSPSTPAVEQSVSQTPQPMQAPTTEQPQVTAPPVVEMTLPTIAPATPGNNWSNSGGNQTSNGSR